MRRLVILFSLVALVTSACEPVVEEVYVVVTATPGEKPTAIPTFIPGESRLPDVPETGQNYYIRRVPEEYLPEFVSKIPNEISRKDYEHGVYGTVLKELVVKDSNGEYFTKDEISIAKPVTDENGVAIVVDPQIDSVIPIIALDENQQTIAGITVIYVSGNGYSTIALYDPEGRYEPQLTVIQTPALALHAQVGGNEHTFLASLLAQPAQAAPLSQITLGAAIIFVLVVAEVSIALDNLEQLILNKEQVFESAYGYEYICRSPELFAAQAGARTHLVLLLFGGKYVMGLSRVVAPQLVEWGVSKSMDEPLLFRRHYRPIPQEEAIAAGVYGMEAVTISIRVDSLEYVEEEVGKCENVPDVLGKTLNEVMEIFDDPKISYIFSVEGDDWENAVVVYQQPRAYEETILGRKLNMVPVGIEGEEVQDVRLRFAVPDIATLTPTSTRTPTPKPASPKLLVAEPVSCRYGPSQVYPILHYLNPGDEVNIVGRHAPGNWWLIQRLDDPSKVCWVYTGAGEARGDTELAPIATPPPTPTPTRTPVPVTFTPTRTPVPVIPTPTPKPTQEGKVAIRDGVAWNDSSCYQDYDPDKCKGVIGPLIGHISCSELKGYGWSDPFFVDGRRVWYVRVLVLFGSDDAVFYEDEARSKCPGLGF